MRMPWIFSLCALLTPPLSARQGPADHIEGIVPKSARERFGTTLNNFPFFGLASRYQQVFAGSELPVARSVGVIGLRQDEMFKNDLGPTVELEIRMAYTSKSHATLSDDFAKNFDSGPAVVVLKRRTLKLDNMPSTLPTDPHEFFLELKLDQPFVWGRQSGKNLLVELTVWKNNNQNLLYYDLDAEAPSTTSMLYAPGNATAAKGTVYYGSGLVMAFLASSLKNFTKGTYREFGQGCKGSRLGAVGPPCVEANASASQVTTATFTGSTLAFQVSVPRAISMTGFEFFGRDGVAREMQAFVYLDNGNKPAASPVRTGTMRTTTTLGWHRVEVSPPLAVPANTTLYLGLQFGPFWNSVLVSGAKVGYFWGGPNWVGPFTSYAFGWKINCGRGSPVAPVLSHRDAPEVGHIFDVELDLANRNAPAVLLLGANKLGISLAPIGAPSCTLLASPDGLLALNTGANGRASVPVYIPALTSLKGAKLYNQFLVLDAAANPLGLTVSNGGEGTIGG